MGHMCLFMLPQKKKTKKLFFISLIFLLIHGYYAMWDFVRIPSSKGGAFCDTIFFFHVLLYLKIEALNVRG